MAKFSINKRTLVEEMNDDFILTRVPNSDMQYYVLVDLKDVVSADEKTIVVEWDDEKRIELWNGKPTLKDAISGIGKMSSEKVEMTANQLHKKYYDEVARKQQEKIVAGKKVEYNRNQEIDNKAEQKQYYNKEQFHEIKMGVRRKLEVKLYSDIHFSAEQMRELRLAQQAGIDISKYNNPAIKAEHMRELRLGAENGVGLDLGKLDQTKYDAAQIKELRLGFEKKLNVNKFLNPEYSAEQMHELRLGQQAGLDTSVYEGIHYTAEQMASVRHQLLLQNIREVIQNMLQQIKSWIGEKIPPLLRKGTIETQKDIQLEIDEAVKEIKNILVKAELISEEKYQDAHIDNRIKEQLENLTETYLGEQQEDAEKLIHKTAKEIGKEVSPELDSKDENVIYVKSTKEAVEEVLQQSELEEEMMEEETWEMIQ